MTSLATSLPPVSRAATSSGHMTAPTSVSASCAYAGRSGGVTYRFHRARLRSRRSRRRRKEMREGALSGCIVGAACEGGVLSAV